MSKQTIRIVIAIVAVAIGAALWAKLGNSLVSRAYVELVVWFGSMYAGRVLAERKGRSTKEGLLLGLFGPLGVLVEFMLPRKRGQIAVRTMIITISTIVAVVAAAFTLSIISYNNSPMMRNASQYMNDYTVGYSASWAMSRADGANSVQPSGPIPGPVIILYPDNRTLDSDAEAALPANLQPTGKGNIEAATVVWVTNWSVTVGTCAGTGIPADQTTTGLTYVQPGTGQVLYEVDIAGPSLSANAECIDNAAPSAGPASASDIAKEVTSDLKPTNWTPQTG